MTVAKLIKELEKLPQNKKVLVYDEGWIEPHPVLVDYVDKYPYCPDGQKIKDVVIFE